MPRYRKKTLYGEVRRELSEIINEGAVRKYIREQDNADRMTDS